MIVGYVKMGGVTLVSIHSNDVLHQIKHPTFQKKKHPTFKKKHPTFQF